MNIYLLSLLAIFAIQMVFFVNAALLKTDKVTDLAYGLTFVVMAIWLVLMSQTVSAVQLMVAAMVTIWGVRLAGYLFVRILKTGRDKRFDGIREKPLKFLSFWTLQAVTIFVVMLPTILLLTRSVGDTFSTLAILGYGMWLIGFVLETVADHQKYVFKNNPKNKNKWIMSGVWKYSQFPNYFGEMLVWWGIFVITIPYLSGPEWLVVSGPIFITIMLLFVTGIPTIRKRYEKRFGKNKEYRAYVKRTSLLVPLPIKK